MTTLEAQYGNEELGLTRQDAIEYIGLTPKEFSEIYQRHDLRLGQFWYASLDDADKKKLRGNFFDPFYRDTWHDVILALRFLLEN